MKALEAERRAELRKRFDEIDTDGNGRISVDEFVALLQSLDNDLSRDEGLLAFEATDEDGDGTIGFDEFLGWWNGD
jgi:Ca2+-binding EF-hand superfamily protein